MMDSCVPDSAIRVFRARDVITMDPSRPRATHVAVQDGRILAVGGADEMACYSGASVATLPAGAVLVPGLVEGHAHLTEGALWRAAYIGYYARRGPDGTLHEGLTDLARVLKRLRIAEAGMPDPTEPLLAWGFDPIYFESRRLDASDLDTVSRTRPIVILHASLHLMTVNSAMLELAGIEQEADIDGIARDSTGKPNGELREFAAMFPIFRILGRRVPISASENAQAVRNFAAVAQLAGVTTAADLANELSEDGIRTLETLTATADFPLRLVAAFAPQRHPGGGVQSVQQAMRLNTDKLKFGAVKFIVDGSIQGFTARLRPPGYLGGQPNGLWVMAPTGLEQAFTPYHRAGLQLHVHVNGDEATDAVLDAMAAMLAKFPREGHRHTLQHCQLADAGQLARAADLGLCVNFFANHLYYWGDAHWEQTVGPQLAQRMNAAATALRLGLKVALHSDAPITPLAPLFTAWCAMRRQSSRGRVLGELECISLEQALHAVTLGSAYTLGLEGQIGSIEPGKLADFAILLQSPYECPLPEVQVWGTVLGGTIFPAGTVGTPSRIDGASE